MINKYFFLTQELISRLDLESEEKLLDSVLENKKAIAKIVKDVKLTTLYKKSLRKMIMNIHQIEKDCDGDNKQAILNAMGNLMNKIIQSPDDKTITEGVIVVLMPVILKFITRLESEGE